MKHFLVKLCALALLFCAVFSPLCVKTQAAEAEPGERSVFAYKPPFLDADKAFRITELLPSLFGRACVSASASPTAAAKVAKLPTKQSELCVGGQTFGVRLFTEGVLVVSVNAKEACHPAYDGGVRPGDLILSIGGKTVRSAKEATRLILESKGNALEFICKRNGNTHVFTVTPVLEQESGHYKAGLWIKDTAAGIGTVTFFDPQSGYFGGLGHGICDSESGALLPISKGTVTSAKITEIIRGQAGKPGELRGFLKNEKIGALLCNTDCGVFGILTAPAEKTNTVKLLTKDKLKNGKAVIRCSLGGDEVKEYAVTISNIDRGAKGAKCFSVHIEDPELLQKTGGIVQGMSGSPILQDGKLAGAVTHVLVNDPTTGYGIFIENMLNAM
ncbi:MAG: SpoIVB peptidase [Clostridia bacterium]|nr:SpoIVB peptidase [Clostridia bacterium]